MLSSFVTTVATPRKCARPRIAPSRRSLRPSTSTRGREAGRVDLLDARARTACRRRPSLGQLGVALLVARVALEVAALVELRRVHEQRHDDAVALLRARGGSATGDRRAARPSSARGRSRGPSRRAGASVARSPCDRAHGPHARRGVVVAVVHRFRSSSLRIPARLEMCTAGCSSGPSRESLGDGLSVDDTASWIWTFVRVATASARRRRPVATQALTLTDGVDGGRARRLPGVDAGRSHQSCAVSCGGGRTASRSSGASRPGRSRRRSRRRRPC